jgi:hypothetical protein
MELEKPRPLAVESDLNSELGWTPSQDEAVDMFGSMTVLEAPIPFEAFEESLTPFLVAPTQIASANVVTDLSNEVTSEQAKEWIFATLFLFGLVYFISTLSGFLIRANAVNYGAAFLTQSAVSAKK